jgi:mannose-1-phosphate guanylyltransferase
MVPLRHKPYVNYLMNSMKAAGLDGAVLSMGYLPDPIKRHFAAQDLEEFSLEYVVEESPSGPQGA